MEVVAYFKGYKGRNAGRKQIILYYEVRVDGTVRVVDLTNKVVKIINSFGSKPYHLEKSNKEFFEKALEEFMRM